MVRKVFICGLFWHAYAKMFMDYNERQGEVVYKGVRSIDEADIVVFTGGPDLNPELYGEERIPGTYSNDVRDNDDQSYFDRAHKAGKFLVGICRGAQFLCVKAGGKLWQDVDNHTEGHYITDLAAQLGNEIWVSSTHHQQMIVTKEIGQILAVADECTVRKGHNKEWTLTEEERVAWDPEAAYFPNIRALAFQPHPEFDGYEECTEYFFTLIERYYE